MSTFIGPSENRPARSILLYTSGSTNATETPAQAESSTPRLTQQTPRPQLAIAIPVGRSPRRRLQQREGSPPPPPPPPPPTNTPTRTIRFQTQPQGPSVVRRRRALRKLSTNGALRPPRPRRNREANDTLEVQLENATTDRTFQVLEMADEARRATAKVEHAMATDPYVLSRWSYPANWVEHNDRVQYSEEPW